MQDETIREALNAHWHASATGDLNAEHNIYAANGSSPSPDAQLTTTRRQPEIRADVP